VINRQVFFANNLEAGPREGNFPFCPYCTSRMEITQIEDRSRPVCPNCGFIQYRNPAPAVAVLVVSGNRFLLGKRLSGVSKGKWATPSGYIEFVEDFLTSGIREVREETGLEITVEAILNVASSFLSPSYHFFSVYLLASVVDGNLQSGDDFSEARWFEFGEPLPELAFEEDAFMIRRYASGRLGKLPVDERYAGGINQTGHSSRPLIPGGDDLQSS
jgi:NADH pyrophosphatase NudC (nudix superfamily)